MKHKTLTAAIRKGSSTPDETKLAAINSMALRDLKAEEVYAREYVSAHNGIDRDREVFDEAVLNDLARTLPGKGFFVRHPSGWDGDTGPGEGRIFDARVESMSFDAARALLREPDLEFPPDRTSATVLFTSTYMAAVPENASLRTKIDAGVAGDVSVGFTPGERVAIKDRAGNTIAYRLVGPREGLELSLVWLGAQPGARALKSKKRGHDMDPNKDNDQAATKVALQSATEKAARFETSAKAHDDFKAALGADDAAVADKPEEAAALVKAGKSYRKRLVSDIVTAERQSGGIGDTPEEVDAATKDYDSLPTARLESLAKRIEGKATAAPAAGIRPSDPNAGPGTKGAPTGEKPAGELANPMIFG